MAKNRIGRQHPASLIHLPTVGDVLVPAWAEDGGYDRRPRIVDDRGTLIEPDPLDVLQPLTARSEKLLAQYYGYRAFWFAVKNFAPTEWAAKQILDVEKTRARQILKDLEESGGPVDWLRGQYMEGISKGTMLRGRETKSSPIADAFFCALEDDNIRVRTALSGQVVVTMESLRRTNQGIEIHIISYWAFRELDRSER